MDDEAVYEARLEIVDFLIETFWDVPSEAFLSRLLSDEVRIPEAEIDERFTRGFDRLRSFVDTNRDRPLETVHDELRTEYTDVFVGPRPPVLAHETYYREDTDFLSEGLAAVQSSYSAAGWSPPEDYGEEHDFVAVELAFLRHLVERQQAGAEESFGYERVFLDEHLLQWYEAFVEDVHRNTDAPLFLAAADVFAGFVEFEDEIVAQMA